MQKLNAHYSERIEALIGLPLGEERDDGIDAIVEEIQAVANSIRCEYRGMYYLGEEIRFSDGSVLHESRLDLLPTEELIDYAREERWDPQGAEWADRPEEDDWD